MDNHIVGLGDRHYRLAVCIGNRPPMPEYQGLHTLKPLQSGDITHIVESTGNHWRKIFNIYAKLMFLIAQRGQPTWQAYRDHVLLQQGCGHTLIFSPLNTLPAASDTILIVSGKSYAQTLGVLDTSVDVGDGFYLNTAKKIIIAPYFDYRQLSNRKLDMLISIINSEL
ncbi:DUF6942 family protein [Alkalimarinus alittae]|uniref:Uncharacterized protein n=1 Tax=Alkalimarinus alittae TaxID=2961619 RepID=A0ABY6N1K5_9ALTE|nr:hypothetical protein [Alkalimarinus alittae]UZE95997.1 hypothetical protein NKI27_18430 [Alkalimarinus alittae]